MIKSVARVTALGRCALMLAGVLAAGAVAGVAAACGTSAGDCMGSYGSAPSSGSATRAMAADSTALTLRHAALGTILTTGQGFTLDEFGADKRTVSACPGACAAAWPPATTPSAHVKAAGGAARSLAGDTIRPGGAPQLTYAGHPLYTFTGDSSPGTTRGQGLQAFGANWRVLTLAGKEVTGG